MAESHSCRVAGDSSISGSADFSLMVPRWTYKDCKPLFMRHAFASHSITPYDVHPSITYLNECSASFDLSRSCNTRSTTAAAGIIFRSERSSPGPVDRERYFWSFMQANIDGRSSAIICSTRLYGNEPFQHEMMFYNKGRNLALTRIRVNSRHHLRH
jgi:hypothetical protein